jgi:hypothetical protein
VQQSGFGQELCVYIQFGMRLGNLHRLPFYGVRVRQKYSFQVIVFGVIAADYLLW